MYARRSFLCIQIRFSTYHSSGNRTSSWSYQARTYRRLQLTDLEQKAVISVRDESLCLRALRRVCSYGCFNGHRNILWENAHARAWRNLVNAPFLPVEHRHRLPTFIVHHAGDQRSRHVGLFPFKLPDALRHASPILGDAYRCCDERADDRGVLPDPFEPSGIRHGVPLQKALILGTSLPHVRT